MSSTGRRNQSNKRKLMAQSTSLGNVTSDLKLPAIHSGRGRKSGVVSPLAALGGDHISSTKVYTKISYMVFSDSEYQNVRADVKRVCLRLEIDPEHLPLKKFQDFAAEGVDEKIQAVRYNHYAHRRMKLLDILYQKLTQ